MEIDHLSMFRGEPGYEDCCERIGSQRITPYLDGEFIDQCCRLCISEGWADVYTDEIINNVIVTKRLFGKVSILVHQKTRISGTLPPRL